MKIFIVLALIAPIFCRPEGGVRVAQDTLGNYKLDYDTLESSRKEERFDDGRVVGSYSFIDTDGIEHTIHYMSGPNQGYTAVGDSLPVAPQPVVDTPEIVHAREEHFAALRKATPTTFVAHTPRSEFHHEAPVDIHAVLAGLVVPKIETLPASYVPAVDAEHYGIKAELLKTYSENLERLAQEYRKRL